VLFAEMDVTYTFIPILKAKEVVSGTNGEKDWIVLVYGYPKLARLFLNNVSVSPRKMYC